MPNRWKSSGPPCASYSACDDLEYDTIIDAMQHLLIQTPRLVTFAYTVSPSLSVISWEVEWAVDPIEMALLPWANVETWYSVLAVDGR